MAFDGMVLNSAWCGLFYLLNSAKRIGLPEMLWRVGISEGDALAAMLRLICADDDPAPDILSPLYPRPPKPLPVPQDWARDELIADIDAAVTDADVRARLAVWDVALRADAGWNLPDYGAAALLALSEQALGQHLDADTIAVRFALPGRIVLDDDRITVRQTIDAIDLDIRRAGLDADPGWLAWLKRDLVFVFDDAGDEM